MDQVVIADEACHAKPALKALLVALGLPLVCRLPRHLEMLLLAHTPGAFQLTPSLVRRHLAQALGSGRPAPGGSAGSASATSSAVMSAALSATSGHAAALLAILLLPAMPSAPGTATLVDGSCSAGIHTPSPAALVLEYCLSDVDASSSGTTVASAASSESITSACTPWSKVQGELEGLPLLPLSDGTLGRIHVLNRASSAKSTVPAQQNLQGQALLQGHGSLGSAGGKIPVFLIPKGKLEEMLLAPAGRLGLASHAMTEALNKQLGQMAAKGVCLQVWGVRSGDG